MSEDLKKKVAEWVIEGLTVSEIHKRLETESGVHLTRLELRLLVGDLERTLQERESPEAIVRYSEPLKGSVPTIDVAKWKPDPTIDHVEIKLRESDFERVIARRIPVMFRWSLFVPVGLAAGIITFVIVLFLFTTAPGEDVVGYGGIGAGLLGGGATVLVGMMVAPRNARVVALIMGGVTVVVCLVSVAFAWTLHDFANRLALLIAIGTYCLCTVITALVVGKPSIFERLYGPSDKSATTKRETVTKK